MRASESICLLFLASFVLLGLIRPIRKDQRLRVVVFGITGFLLIWTGTMLPFLRDWIPALILLLVYWQGGNFFSRPHTGLQDFLESMEEKYFSKWTLPFHMYWEIAYFFCYPLVPGAVAVLYALDLRNEVNFFWTVVLPPTLICHLIVSFYQTYPPWKFRQFETIGSVRKLNFLVLEHASIQLNTFPSAHVAASIAAALAILHLHWIAGIVVLFFALSIMVSTVVGRYHYGADALFGFFLAVGWYGAALLFL
jgi:membrane-associated phospholipid phosphatase